MRDQPYEALHPDVLLLDIAMPGLDGIGVAKALAAQLRHPPWFS